MIAVPATEESLGRALGQAHQRYSAVVNAQHGWTGNLWANRFHSSVMDDEHLRVAVRSVELNPVRARMVEQPTDDLRVRRPTPVLFRLTNFYLRAALFREPKRTGPASLGEACVRRKRSIFG